MLDGLGGWTAMAEPGIERIAAAFAARARRGPGRADAVPDGRLPRLATSPRSVEAYADAGADLIELGVPFSDPLADGPVIHAAGDRGARRRRDASTAILELCERRRAPRVPVLLMVYANIVLARGSERVRRGARASRRGRGDRPRPAARGGAVAEALLRRAGLALIRSSRRRRPPSACARDRRAGAVGFVYVVSLTGVTGERGELPPELGETGRGRPRPPRTLPVAVGFGIATPEQAAAASARIADGVIIGSRLVRAVGRGGRPAPTRRVERSSAFLATRRRRPVDFRADAAARLHSRRRCSPSGRLRSRARRHGLRA